jgi:hypothetical protein
MARLPFITAGIFFLIGAAGAAYFAQAQVPRPGMPGQRPTQPPVTAPQAGAPQNPGTTVTAPAASQPPQSVPRTADSPVGPTVAPVVTYRDGLLTVQALNSNLGSVVKAIRSKTGIEFEGAENISETVAISLGPAPAGDVLSAIFSGSKYDFVALGRPDSPSIVQRVILTVRNNPGAPGQQAQPQPRAVPQGEGDDEEAPEEQPNGGDPQDTAVQPPQIPQQQPPQPENQPQQQPKSPEQLLQELQQMQNQKAPPDPQNPSTAPRKMPPRAN